MRWRMTFGGLRAGAALLGAAGATCAVATCALGAMGPGFGLPRSWTPTAARGLFVAPAPVVSGNALSAMCVECHGANRSGALRFGARPFGEAEARYRGSHFIRNAMDGLVHATVASPPEKLDEWGGTGTGRRSKYGNFTTLQSVTGVAGEMVCESCHNLVRNSNPSLLLDAFSGGTGVATLCQGCHATITGLPSHHPLGAVDATDDASVRNPPLDPLETDEVRYFAAPNVVTCVSCHKVHDAQTATGARILRRGHSQVAAIAGVLQGPVNVVYYVDRPDTGSVPGTQLSRSSTGLHRQSDMIVAGRRLVTSADPLCDACHKYDD